MESTPVNWEALDTLVIEFAKLENLIEDSSSAPSPSPSSSPSSSSYHSRLIIRQIRRFLETGAIDAAVDLLRLHAPSILNDHRILFRLHKQVVIYISLYWFCGFWYRYCYCSDFLLLCRNLLSFFGKERVRIVTLLLIVWGLLLLLVHSMLIRYLILEIETAIDCFLFWFWRLSLYLRKHTRSSSMFCSHLYMIRRIRPLLWQMR